MFDPPTAHELIADVAEAVRHFGHIVPSGAFWLAERLSVEWQNNPERTIIQSGERFSKQQMLDAEMSQWEHVGGDAWDYLSDEGRKLGLKAYAPTIRRASGRYYLAREYSRYRRDLAFQFPFVAVMVLSTSPRLCCEEARAVADVLFTTAQSLPTLPLPNCQRDICGCAYRGVSITESRERRGG